jgi:hypothetical protein
VVFITFSNSNDCYHRIVMQTLWFSEIFCIAGWLAIAFAKVSLPLNLQVMPYDLTSPLMSIFLSHMATV